MSAAEKRLRAQLDRLTPALQRELQAALDTLRRRAAPVLQAMAAGDAFALSRLLREIPADLQRATHVLEQALKLVALQTVKVMPVAMRFDVPNAAASQFAAQHAARLITEVSLEARKTVQQIIAHAFTQEITPRATARLIRDAVPLASRQSAALLKFRQQLIARGASAEVVADRVAREAARLLRRRALTIARTEIIEASTRGQQLAWHLAMQKGLLPVHARQRWIITDDDRLCPLCAQMVGERATAPLPGFFNTPLGRKHGPPMHPNCRCSVAIDAKSLSVRRVA